MVSQFKPTDMKLNKSLIKINHFCLHSGINWSDVVCGDYNIAALAEKPRGIFQDIKSWYQILVPEEYKDIGDHHYISEDVGFVFVCFYDLDEGLNKIINFHENTNGEFMLKKEPVL